MEDKYKLFGYSTLGLFSEKINTLSSEESLNSYKLILFKNINSKHINLLQSILELNGLLLLSDNARFLENLRNSKEIQKLNSFYENSKHKNVFSNRQIEFCDSIFKSLNR